MKLAGSVLILSAVTWITGAVLSARRKKLRSLRALSELLIQICGELETRALPIPELLEVLSSRTSAVGKNFVNTLREQLSRLGAAGFSDLWDASVLTAFPDTEEEAGRILHRAGLALGRYELRHQCQVLSQCAQELESVCCRGETALASSGRLMWGLNMASAGLLIILLN